MHRVGLLVGGGCIHGRQRHGVKVDGFSQRGTRGAIRLRDNVAEDIPDVMCRAVVGRRCLVGD
jgi:hypothetical protein